MSIRMRLKDEDKPIHYFLLLLDEADAFLDSCKDVQYKPFDALKDIQAVGEGRFKFVVAGLRDVLRFEHEAALNDNSVLPQLSSMTVKPFKYAEAKELLEYPLSYLGFRFRDDVETDTLVSAILSHTNSFPGMLQLYCTKLIEAMKMAMPATRKQVRRRIMFQRIISRRCWARIICRRRFVRSSLLL